MANWTGLAGAAGLAAALEEIQGRRVKEAQLQKELTSGQGEWLPATGGMGGPLGFFDALFGYNKPGQIGFGGQRYQFQPYPKMTEEDVRGLGLTMPQTTTTPAYEKPLPPDVQGPLELVPEQETTREMPLPGFVGQRLDPKTRQALALERFKEHRDLARLKEEYRLASQGLMPGSDGGGAGTKTQAFVIPGTEPATSGATATTPALTPATTPAAGTGKPPTYTPQQQEIVQLIRAEADRQKVDPDLAVAVAMQESSLRPDNHGDNGKSRGLFHLQEKAAIDAGIDPKMRDDVMTNIKGGVTYLRQKLEQSGGNVEQALSRYNRGTPNYRGIGDPDYEYHVLRHYPGHPGGKGPKDPAAYQTRWGIGTAQPAATPAATPAVGGTGMQVAGPGAPASPTARSTPEQDEAYRVSQGQPPAAVTPGPQAAVPPTTGATGTAAQPSAQAPAQAPVQPSATYTPSAELTQQVQNNAQKIAANDERMNRIEINRRMAEVQTRKGMPGAVDRLRMYSEQWAALDRENKALNQQSNDAYKAEHGRWQEGQQKEIDRQKAVPTKIAEEQRGVQYEIDKEGRLVKITIDKEGRELKREIDKEQRGVAVEIDKEGRAVMRQIDAEGRAVLVTIDKEGRELKREIEKEGRQPDVVAKTEAAKQQVQQSEDIRNLTRDLKDKGLVDNADFNKLSEPQQAIVIRTATKYADNKKLVENLDNYSKAALSQILADDKTPMGEVSEEQLRRASEQGAARVKQQKDDEIEAQRLAKLNEPMKDFALKYFHPKLLRVADGTMTAPEAEKLGYRLTPVENQKTLMAADNSISSINRVYTLLFGGDDPDGSITGTVGQKFDGIYPTLEKGRTDTQSAIARTKMTMQLKKGIFQGTDIGQSASALQKYIQGTLGALSRDLGGERGHFTDFDAKRIQGLFQDLQTGMFAVGPMTSSGEAKKLMRSIVATISDRVRTSGSLRRDDPLPWDVSGERRKAPQAGVPATGTVQEPVRTPPVAQEPVPTPPAVQETAPAPAAPTSQRPNAPAAAQPGQRLEQLTTQYAPAQFAGRTIKDPVTGIRYRSDGTAWQEVQ